MPTTAPTYHRLARGLKWCRRLFAGVICAGVLLPASAGAAALVIEGAGDGHGVGMSQDGARGYAEHGYTYEQILAHYYTGTAIGKAPAGAIIKVLVGSKVERVPLERYVRGVVAAEMPSSWPMAALEAQAVASRTYALTSDAGGSRFDVYADTRSQVYRGAAAETAASNGAVQATAGQIVTYAGKPATTYFFASSGGMTEDIQYAWPGATPEPWLVGVPDEYETGSLYAWKVQLGFTAAAHALKGLYRGTFRGVEVLKRGVSPRIVSARVLGSGGNSTVTGPELAGRLGLSSTWAYFSVLSGHSLKHEPDRSGVTAPTPTTSPTTTTTTPTPAGPGGGASAVVESQGGGTSTSSSGGEPAP